MNDTQHASRVLVVDDSPDTLAMLVDALRMEGMEVTISVNGRQAIATALDVVPDIVLMDAVMPGVSGFETCEALKSGRGFEDIPVIFMTGYNESEHVVRALAAGGVDFVSKPIALDQLFARMRVHLANARRARSARRALDSTGRRIVACNINGRVNWSTPQAADLLERSGIRAEANSFMPLPVVNWLAGIDSKDGHPEIFRYSRNGVDIEFRIVGDTDDGEVLMRLIDRHRGTDEEQLAKAFGISPREAEVLVWLTHGKSNKEIAEILEMSPRTVNKHLEQIFNKLAVEKRTSAATMAVKVLWQKT